TFALTILDITRTGEEAFKKLQESDMKIHIIGVNSDLFFTAEENRETFKRLAQANTNVTYGEVQSLHGHDAFLMEFEQLEKLLETVFQKNGSTERIKVLKFGGKSLANGEGIERVLKVIAKRALNKEHFAVVVSARGKATDELESLLDKAAKGKDFKTDLVRFAAYQKNDFSDVDIEEELQTIERILNGVSLTGDYSLKTKDEVLSYGELISAKVEIGRAHV